MSNTIINRIFRIAFGSGLILATLVVNAAPLGGFAVLPLIAIPLILSGIYGENPIGELLDKPLGNIKTRFVNTIAKSFKHPTIAA